MASGRRQIEQLAMGGFVANFKNAPKLEPDEIYRFIEMARFLNQYEPERELSMILSNDEIISSAKMAEKRNTFSKLSLGTGINSAYGIGYMDGMVDYREHVKKILPETNLQQIHAYGLYFLGAMLAANKMADMLNDPAWRLNAKPYQEATLRLILRDKRSIQLWMEGCYYIHYRNHKKNAKGKVIWCEAYFSNERGKDAPEVF